MLELTIVISIFITSVFYFNKLFCFHYTVLINYITTFINICTKQNKCVFIITVNMIQINLQNLLIDLLFFYNNKSVYTVEQNIFCNNS